MLETKHPPHSLNKRNRRSCYDAGRNLKLTPGERREETQEDRRRTSPASFTATPFRRFAKTLVTARADTALVSASLVR